MKKSVFSKTLENIRNRVDILLISSDKVAQKLAAKPNFDRCTIFDENLIAVHMKKTKLYFNKPVWTFSTWVNPWRTTFITTILRLNIEITPNYSSDTDSLAYEIRIKDFYKDINPKLRNGLTLVTTQLIILLELKQDLIVKCLDCLRMKLVGSRLLNLLVWELNFALTKWSIALKIKNVTGWQRMLQKGVFNSMTIESAAQQEGTTSKNECHTKLLSWDLYRRN